MKILALIWQVKMVMTKDDPECLGMNYHHQPRDCMAPEKAVSDIESKRRVQETMIRKLSLLSYSMRG